MMIEIYIKGNRIDTDADTRLGLKFTGGIFRIADNELTRSYGLSVPMTDSNNIVLGFDGDPTMEGVRTAAKAVVMSGGVVLTGDIYLQSYGRGRFELLFVQTRGGWELTAPIGTLGAWSPSITVNDKEALHAGTIPNFGWYRYFNGVSGGNEVGDPAAQFPVTNLGYLLSNAAGMAGYMLQYLNGGSAYEDAANYGIVLPTMDTYSSATVTVNGNARGGWSTVVSGGQTLADVGLSIVVRRYKRGLFGANVTVYTFTAIRHIRVKCTANYMTGPMFAQGQGIRENWLNWQVQAGSVLPYFTDIDLELDAGEWFTMVSRADIVDGIFADYVKLSGGYETNIPATTLEVLDNDGVAGNGETIYLDSNLPDLTLADLLTIYCNLTCSSWTVDDANHRIVVETFDHALANAGTHVVDLDAARVVSVESVERYLDGFAQHNYVRCRSAAYVTEEYKFLRDYPCANDILEDDADYAVIPCNEGNWMIDGNGDRVACFEDVEANENGSTTYKGALSLFFANPDPNGQALHLQTINDVGGMGAGFAAFTGQAVTVRMLVAMTLRDFSEFAPSTVCTWRGRDYIVRSATWSEGKCNLELVRLEI